MYVLPVHISTSICLLSHSYSCLTWVFHGWHCTPATLSLLGPILHAWVLVRMALVSFWLVSRLVFPFAFMLLWDLPYMYAFRLVSLQLLYPHVFHIRCLFLLFSPWLPLHIYKTRKACMFCQFVYRLRSVVSLLLVLDLSLPRYSTSSVLWKLLDSRSTSLSTRANLEDYFHGTLDSATSLWLLGVHIPAYNSKYLDRDRRAEASVQIPLDSGTTRSNLCVG